MGLALERLGEWTTTNWLTVDRDRAELGLTHIRTGPQMIDLVTLDGPLGEMGGAAPGVGANCPAVSVMRVTHGR